MIDCGAQILRDGEYTDDLQKNGYRIIQKKDVFHFGTDSVLLAHFASPRKRDQVVDLGCGTGAISLIMLAHNDFISVTGVEIQDDVADMASRSAALNNVSDRFKVVCGDMRHIHEKLGYGGFTLAVCNPPYFKNGGALLSRDEGKRIARHEGDLTPEEIASSAARLLRSGGRFAVIYPAPRALEMMQAMEKSGIAPKRVMTVHWSAEREPKHILIDGTKGASPGLHWQRPLILTDPNGEYSAQWHEIYGI